MGPGISQDGKLLAKRRDLECPLLHVTGKLTPFASGGQILQHTSSAQMWHIRLEWRAPATWVDLLRWGPCCGGPPFQAPTEMDLLRFPFQHKPKMGARHSQKPSPDRVHPFLVDAFASFRRFSDNPQGCRGSPLVAHNTGLKPL